MKVSSIPIATVALIVTSAFVSIVLTKADTFTLAIGGGLPRAASYQVPTNVVAKVISSRTVSPTYLYVGFPGATNASWYYDDQATYVFANLPTVVGPATITLSNSSVNNTFVSFCTVQTSSASSLSATPSSSVVIPADSGGPVTIILESSTDLINWVAANPGTYGTTTSNRFFRVRAQR